MKSILPNWHPCLLLGVGGAACASVATLLDQYGYVCVGSDVVLNSRINTV